MSHRRAFEPAGQVGCWCHHVRTMRREAIADKQMMTSEAVVCEVIIASLEDMSVTLILQGMAKCSRVYVSLKFSD